MTSIKNIHPLDAEKLFDLLKREFADYINPKLNAALTIEYAHVYDVVNVLFPEVSNGITLTVTVSDTEITVTDNTAKTEYNTELLQSNLIDFITLKAG